MDNDVLSQIESPLTGNARKPVVKAFLNGKPVVTPPKVAKKTPAPKVAEKPMKVSKATAQPKEPLSGKIALKTICQELKLDPKAARVKLRRASLGFHDSANRWEFTAAQADKVREVLAPKKATK